MKIHNYDNKFPYIIVDNYYDAEELSMIWEELEFLSYPCKLKRATVETGGATDNDGNLVKHNYHRYIDNIYEERELSNILTVNRKLFAFDYKIFRQHPHWFFQNLLINQDFTQISYYEENNEYGEHRDGGMVTALTWLYKEPKRFTGGDLLIGSNKIKIDCVNNRTVIIPSMVIHAVSKIQISPEYRTQRLGRYAISQFGNNVMNTQEKQ